jgi:hypothetical protein
MFLPVFILNVIVFVWTFGLRILPDMVIILLVATALIPLSGKLLMRKPPFSQSFSVAGQSDGWLVFAFFPLMALLWGLHVFIRTIPAGIWIYVALLVVTNVLFWTKLHRHRVKRAPVTVEG